MSKFTEIQKNNEVLQNYATKRLHDWPLTTEHNAYARLKLVPTMTEVVALLGEDFGKISFGSIDSFGYETYFAKGYNLELPAGKLHPDIKEIAIPDSQWMFGDDGHWLNPFTPRVIKAGDEDAKQLFGLDYQHDLLVIPVCKATRYKGSEEHPENLATMRSYTLYVLAKAFHDQSAKGLLCVMRVSPEAVEGMKELLQDKELFYCSEGDQPVLTWFHEWERPSNTHGVCSGAQQAFRASCEKREDQEQYLRQGSYDELVENIAEAWETTAQETREKHERQAYLDQLEDSRALFKSSDTYHQAGEYGYGVDLSGEEAVIYRERVHSEPGWRYGKKPVRERVFSKAFPMTPNGLTMLNNFLKLIEGAEATDNARLLKASGEAGLTIKWED